MIIKKNKLILSFLLGLFLIVGCENIDSLEDKSRQGALLKDNSRNKSLTIQGQHVEKAEYEIGRPFVEQSQSDDEALLSVVEDELESVKNVTVEEKEGSVLYLIDMLQNESSEIRLEAVIGLKDFTYRPDVVTELLAMLDDVDDQVVLEAIEALSEVNDERVIASFYEIADSQAEEIIKEVARDYAEELGQE